MIALNNKRSTHIEVSLGSLSTNFISPSESLNLKSFANERHSFVFFLMHYNGNGILIINIRKKHSFHTLWLSFLIKSSHWPFRFLQCISRNLHKLRFSLQRLRPDFETKQINFATVQRNIVRNVYWRIFFRYILLYARTHIPTLFSSQSRVNSNKWIKNKISDTDMCVRGKRTLSTVALSFCIFHSFYLFVLLSLSLAGYLILPRPEKHFYDATRSPRIRLIGLQYHRRPVYFDTVAAL